MARRLFLSLVTFLSLAAVAFADAPGELTCRATHDLACDLSGCRNEADTTIQVVLTLESDSGSGELCTYTYCRDFVLVPQPGQTVDEATADWTGFTLSAKRGSTGAGAHTPTIDYQLSVSVDRTRFFLGNVEDGGIHGWLGTCSRAEGVNEATLEN